MAAGDIRSDARIEARAIETHGEVICPARPENLRRGIWRPPEAPEAAPEASETEDSPSP